MPNKTSKTSVKKPNKKAATKSTAKKSGRSKAPKKIISVWQLTKNSGQLLWTHKKQFLGLAFIYGLLILIFVKGFSLGQGASSIKSQVNAALQGSGWQFGGGAIVLVSLISEVGAGSSDAAGAYRFFFTVIISLAIIWSLRQTLANKAFRIRDAFYHGLYPAAQFVLVLLVILLQLVPIIIGASLYSIVIGFGIAASALEIVLWFMVFLGLASLSFYFLCSSLFALYITTLPNMTPIPALRSARALVKGKRWIIARKILALPIVLFLIGVLIMLPIIYIAAPLAQYILFILSILMIFAVHTYMYLLYRDLVNE